MRRLHFEREVPARAAASTPVATREVHLTASMPNGHRDAFLCVTAR
jgi:hypothetical protein